MTDLCCLFSIIFDLAILILFLALIVVGLTNRIPECYEYELCKTIIEDMRKKNDKNAN